MVKRIPYRLLTGILSVLLVLLSVPLRETGFALSAEAAGTEPDRYVVIVVDNSDTQQFLNSEGEVFFTADTALDDVKLGAQRLLAELNWHNSKKKGGHYYAALVSYTKTAYAYNEGAFTDEFVA